MSLNGVKIKAETFLTEDFVLPPLPELVTKIMELISSGSAGAREIGGLIEADPALTSQVLKVVNSAYYGLPTRITDLKHAVAYLGLAEIQRLVLALSVMKQLQPEDKEVFERFWYHSYYTTVTAKYMAKTFEKTLDSEDLYIATLLHDIGKLVYLKFFPEHFRVLSRWAKTEGKFLVDAEQHYDWPSHMTLGVLLCEHWKLPPAAQKACDRHELAHLKENPGNLGSLNRVICLSNLLVNLASDSLNEDLKNEIRGDVSRALDCNESDFLMIMGEIYDLNLEVSRFLEQLS